MQGVQGFEGRKAVGLLGCWVVGEESGGDGAKGGGVDKVMVMIMVII